MQQAETVAEQALDAAPTPEVTEVAQPEVAQAEAGQVELTEADLDNVSPEDAYAFLHEGKAIEVPDKKPEAKVEEAAPETEEPAAEVETTPPVATEEPAAPEKILPNRITTSQFDEREQKAINLMHVVNAGKKPGDVGRIGIADALAQLDQMEGKGKAATPPAPTPIEQTSAKVTEAETHLAALREQKKEAIENGEPVTEIEEQIELARDAVIEQRVEAKHQQAAKVAETQSEGERQRAAIRADLSKDFPTMDVPTSDLGIAIRETITDLHREDHPDHLDLFKVEAPEKVLTAALKHLAKKDGISLPQAVLKYSAPAQAPVAAKAAPAPKPPATPPPKKFTPANGSQATQPPKGQPSVQEVYDALKDDGDGQSAWDAVYGDKPLNLLRP